MDRLSQIEQARRHVQHCEELVERARKTIEEVQSNRQDTALWESNLRRALELLEIARLNLDLLERGK